MKTVFMAVMISLILMVVTVCAETMGDINGDGKINLTEAAGALQVVSGNRIPLSYTVTTDGKTYDTRAYVFGQTSGKKIYRQTIITGNGNAETGIGIIIYSKEKLNGQEVTAATYETGLWAKYDEIDYYIGNKYLGWQDSGYFSMFDPPSVYMKDTWSLGDKVINIPVIKSDGYDNIESRNFELLGEEYVTVPAGTFKCLKILSNRSWDGIHELIYLAKGLGDVKVTRADVYGDGFIWELMDVQKADGTYMFGNGKNICEARGTWTADGFTCNQGDSNCMGQGTFNMEYIKGDTNPTFLSLHNFWNWDYNNGNLSMVTKDGINFSPDPNAYTADNNNGKPYIPDISLTIDNGNITGTFNTNGQGFTLKGTVTCP